MAQILVLQIIRGCADHVSRKRGADFEVFISHFLGFWTEPYAYAPALAPTSYQSVMAHLNIHTAPGLLSNPHHHTSISKAHDLASGSL